MTRAERAAQAERMRAAWAAGKFDDRRAYPLRADAWTRDEDAWLRAHGGEAELPELTQRLNATFYRERTPCAVRMRATRLGVSLWVRGHALREVADVFGVCWRTVVRRWVRDGLLVGRRWNGRGPRPGWWFDDAEVERFLREHGYAYDWRHMRAGHRWTRLAEVTNRADPWHSLEELAAYVGTDPENLDRWVARGVIPIKRRPNIGGASGGQRMVRRRDFGAIKEAIIAGLRESRQAGARAAAIKRQEIARERYGVRLNAPACKRGHAWPAHRYVRPGSGRIECMACKVSKPMSA